MNKLLPILTLLYATVAAPGNASIPKIQKLETLQPQEIELTETSLDRRLEELIFKASELEDDNLQKLGEFITTYGIEVRNGFVYNYRGGDVSMRFKVVDIDRNGAISQGDVVGVTYNGMSLIMILEEGGVEYIGATSPTESKPISETNAAAILTNIAEIVMGSNNLEDLNEMIKEECRDAPPEIRKEYCE